MSSVWLRQGARPAHFSGAALVAVWCTLAPAVRAEPARRPVLAVAPTTPADPASAKPPAPAAPPPTAPTFDGTDAGGVDESARLRARALYDQGARAYSEGRFYQAADLFLDAHRVYPTPQLLFNVAKAYDKLGAQSGALSFFRDYLRHLPDAPDAAEVGARVHELEALLAQRGVQQLSVLSDPPQALLSVDGTAAGITPWTGETWPGTHRLTLTLAGKKPLTTLISVEPHRAQDFTFDLEPTPIAPAEKRATDAAPPPRAPTVSALTWVVLGTGTAALASALFVEMANKNTTGLSRTGAFFGGAGLAASALGGLLLYVDLSVPEIAPTRPRAVRATLSGRF